MSSKRREAYCIVGRQDAGKSSIIRALTGYGRQSNVQEPWDVEFLDGPRKCFIQINSPQEDLRANFYDLCDDIEVLFLALQDQHRNRPPLQILQRLENEKWTIAGICGLAFDPEVWEPELRSNPSPSMTILPRRGVRGQTWCANSQAQELRSMWGIV